jgi:hypothetical protein
MRRALIRGALAAVSFAAAAPAQQQPVDSTRPAVQVMDGRLRAEIAVLSRLMRRSGLPAADSFSVGNLAVPAGTTRRGPVAVARGNLDIHGRVEGDAVALHGNVVIHPGGYVTGNVAAVDGRVRVAGGVVEGDVRSVTGLTGDLLSRAAGRATEREPLTTWGAIRMVLAWFAILSVMGIGVLLFAERNLDGVVLALERQFTRSFWTGVLAQLAAIPALLVSLVALCVTVLGILLIPFAVVAYIIAIAGLLMLGFLAVARFTGRAFSGNRALPGRRISLRALLIGIGLYVGLWLLAAVFVWNPMIGAVLRAVALAGSWVALTLGLGATLITRAGTRREGELRRHAAAPASDMSWQTPTPVTGVVAARRPVMAVKEKP